jgi:Sec-independent protein translocase protein TatA
VFSLGGSEILVLAVIALLLFGNKNLPENMKKMVKGLNEAKKVANDAQRSWTEIRNDVTRQIMADDALEEAKKELANIKSVLEARAQLPETVAVPDETIALAAPDPETAAAAVAPPEDHHSDPHHPEGFAAADTTAVIETQRPPESTPSKQ